VRPCAGGYSSAMADPPPGPRLTPEAETRGRRTLRRSILLIIAVFAAYGVVTTLSESTPNWAKVHAEDFPATLRMAHFGDGELAPGKPYVIHIKRTGHKRTLPPQRMELSVLKETRATYRCRKRTRCPWIRIAPLSCRLDGAAASPCGFELFEFGRTGVKILPRRRCRLTRPGIRDLNVACPHDVAFGPKEGAKPAPKRTSKRTSKRAAQ
jgi:hypothetical protein